jgi:hypothetical protein
MMKVITKHRDLELCSVANDWTCEDCRLLSVKKRKLFYLQHSNGIPEACS